ncbi:tRNA(Ile)-lysidine synthase/bifunctional protein TilS/HprT [Planomicrobium soli]|uniref:tRNA(Ile)-lysidine synthase n=1 Tax=Planomicrobium soli TaxID=1176648 RepID=A0A2P8FZI2_9BACL|nr:tRNA lysidine(34) synthetase TilS [Planomicrobium soli]PSL27136.1 tRNA(Ile)-lysidine synthase/bifunctional protein TilS/HprT [Planomicrobium soli]
MKSFQEKVYRHLAKHQLLVPGDHVLVGCSGGIDSVVLLHFLMSRQAALDISVTAVHVNHMLREEESLADRVFTEQLCAEWRVPCFSRDVPIPEILKSGGGNKQQVCREERYAYFSEVMEQTGATKFATAHHADDQLETILMAGVKGTLQSGSFGMPTNRRFGDGRLVRPLLAVTKAEIISYAHEFGLSYREDPSNGQPDYTRNRIRQTVVPLLKHENSGVSAHFVELAETMQEDQRFLMELAKEKMQQLIEQEEGGFSISVDKFRQEALALQKRLVLLLLNYLYNEKRVAITKQLAEQVRVMMHSSAGTAFLHLPQNCMMIRQYDRMYFSWQPIGEAAVKDSFIITDDWCSEVNGFRYKAVPLKEAKKQDDAVFWYFSAPDEVVLTVRNRKPGDRIHLSGMIGTKKVARLMIDEKVPVSFRDKWPVIETTCGEILLVPGIRPSKFISRTERIEDNWVLIEQQVKAAKSGL